MWSGRVQESAFFKARQKILLADYELSIIEFTKMSMAASRSTLEKGTVNDLRQSG